MFLFEEETFSRNFPFLSDANLRECIFKLEKKKECLPAERGRLIGRTELTAVVLQLMANVNDPVGNFEIPIQGRPKNKTCSGTIVVVVSEYPSSIIHLRIANILSLAIPDSTRLEEQTSSDS